MCARGRPHARALGREGVNASASGVWIGGDAYRQLARVAGATRQRVGQIVKEADSSS